MNPIKIDIWSDVVCPFCYIGKRKLESAIQEFGSETAIEITWHSFQLDPNLVSNSTKNSAEYLSETKGIPMEQVEQMINRVEYSATQMGLDFKLDDTKVANTFKAHRLLQFAKTHNLGSEMKERLFKAYFVDGKNVDDTDELLVLAKEVGLNTEDSLAVLNSNLYSENVKSDLAMASEIGIRGVPFFVFNQKFAISGAQDSSVFLDSLKKAAETVTL